MSLYRKVERVKRVERSSSDDFQNLTDVNVPYNMYNYPPIKDGSDIKNITIARKPNVIRGKSLMTDMCKMFNNPNYGDIKIICKDSVPLHACRAILAARSETFYQILSDFDYIETKEIYFRMISEDIMKIILLFIYTGKLCGRIEDSDDLGGENDDEYDLVDFGNVIELYVTADYFQLVELQNLIVEFIREACERENRGDIAPKLLNDAVKLMHHILPISDDDISVPLSPCSPQNTECEILTLLTEAVSQIPLDNIKFGRLSLRALKYLLMSTYHSNKIFKAQEYTVLRYALLLSARTVSKDAFYSLENRLPTWDNIKNNYPPILCKNDMLATYNNIRRDISHIVTPLLEYIDFQRIDAMILEKLIEPLDIINQEIITKAYRFHATNPRPKFPISTEISNRLPKSDFRKKKPPIPPKPRNNKEGNSRNISHSLQLIGQPFAIKWDKHCCSPGIKFADNNSTVYVNDDKLSESWKSVRSNLLMTAGTYSWAVHIKSSEYVGMGVCSKEFNHNFPRKVENQVYAWILGSDGLFYHGEDRHKYADEFYDTYVNSIWENKIDVKVEITVNMDEKWMKFTINGKRHEKVNRWLDFPDELWPVCYIKGEGSCKIVNSLKQL
ncbi:982_t:CDS:2 [Acaulospora morrowiae]|uniref:982_t:CDS:1 n=1 Tax=Acaulospora morrowiae TaxID=94023 RepID=A0A9N8VDJ6_9GLOM|nr:982_t:CDS:2 [Acaulospora morrowiae]